MIRKESSVMFPPPLVSRIDQKLLAKKLLCRDFSQLLIIQMSDSQTILRSTSSEAARTLSIKQKTVFHAKKMVSIETARPGPIQKS